MAGRLSFSIAINLLIDNFKQGVRSVKGGFQAMQAKVLTFAAALGFGGIGLSNFVSKLIQTARETNRVTTALQNVSGSSAAYANNQRWLLSLAKKYGVEINGLTAAYAQFTASAQISGMALIDQRKIFESVSRATVAFGMSADDSKGVYLALSQMMSKGKISSEELRQQMGERLPVALQAMAKAAGVPISKLDDLLKKGKVLSADVLPRFADALNEMVQIKNADTLEASMNKLSNVFTEAVKDSGLKDYYKSFIDWLTDKVSWGAENIKSIARQLVAALTGVILARFFKWALGQLTTAQTEARRVAKKIAKDSGQAFDEVAWRARSGAETTRMAWIRAVRTIKTALISIAPAILLTGISMLIAHLVNVRKEAKRIKRIFSDYKKESFAIGRPEDADKLQRLYKIATDTTTVYNIRKNALTQINELLGTSYAIDAKNLSISGDINTKLAERVKLLKDAAAVEFYQQKKLDIESKLREILYKYGGSQENFQRAINAARNSTVLRGPAYHYNSHKEVLKDAAIWEQYLNILRDSEKQLSYFEQSLLSGAASGLSVSPASTPEENEKIQKVEEDYAARKKEYTNQLAAGAIKEQEYQQAVDALNREIYKKLAGLLAENELKTNKTYLAAKEGAENPLRGKTADMQDSYWSGRQKLAEQYALNLISEKDYQQQLIALTADTLKTAASFSEIDAAGLAFIEALNTSQAELLANVKLPEIEPRDTTFDYRLTRPEQIAADRAKKEEYAGALKSEIGRSADDLARDIKTGQLNLDALKQKYNSIAPVLVEELNKAMAEVTSLDDALKLAEVQQEIKDLGKEIDAGIYAGVKNIGSSAERVANSIQNVKDTFNNVDASGWEKILSIWNAIADTADSFIETLEMLERLTELTYKLAAAKQVESAIDKKATADKVQNAATGAMADMAAASVKRSTATTEVAANTAAAASEAGRSAAKLPFPINLIAIGSAVASVLAIFASLPKFSSGGVARGSSGGDVIPALLKDGEIVLNNQQQANLFSILNGKSKAGGSSGDGTVEFVIKGDKLVGVLNNYNRRQNRIK